MEARKIAVSFLFIAFSISISPQPVKLHGKLHVDGVQLKDEHDNDVVLRGMSFG
jgi:hypothetical protein